MQPPSFASGSDVVFWAWSDLPKRMVGQNFVPIGRQGQEVPEQVRHVLKPKRLRIGGDCLDQSVKIELLNLNPVTFLERSNFSSLQIVQLIHEHTRRRGTRIHAVGLHVAQQEALCISIRIRQRDRVATISDGLNPPRFGPAEMPYNVELFGTSSQDTI